MTENSKKALCFQRGRHNAESHQQIFLNLTPTALQGIKFAA